MPANRFTVRVAHNLHEGDAAFDLAAHSIAFTPCCGLDVMGEGGRRSMIPASSWLSITVSHAEQGDPAVKQERPRGLGLHAGLLAALGLAADKVVLLSALH